MKPSKTQTIITSFLVGSIASKSGSSVLGDNSTASNSDYAPKPTNVPPLEEISRKANLNLQDGDIVSTKPQTVYTPKPTNVSPLEE